MEKYFGTDGFGITVGSDPNLGSTQRQLKRLETRT